MHTLPQRDCSGKGRRIGVHLFIQHGLRLRSVIARAFHIEDNRVRSMSVECLKNVCQHFSGDVPKLLEDLLAQFA